MAGFRLFVASLSLSEPCLDLSVYIWYLWWTKRQFSQFVAECFSSPLLVSVHQCPILNHLSPTDPTLSYYSKVSLSNIHEIKSLELALTVYFAISNFGVCVK